MLNKIPKSRRFKSYYT